MMPGMHRVFQDVQVDELTGCREWLGYKLDSGYGQIRHKSRLWRTHRLAWHLSNGPIPEGAMVLHHCDNRICCNPEHLFLGHAQDKSNSMVRRGKHARGERNSGAKITAEDVRWVRLWVRSGYTRVAVAKVFGLSAASVTNIVNRKKWRHVDAKSTG